MYRVLFIIVFILISNTVLGNNIPVYDVSDENVEFGDFSVALYVDSAQNKSIEQIEARSQEMTLVNSRFIIHEFGHNYWFAFTLINTSELPVNRIVGFDEAYMEVADIYYKSDKEWFCEKGGLSQSMSQRKIKSRCPVFYVELQGLERKTIYIKLYSEFNDVQAVIVESAHQFAYSELIKTIGYWFYFGGAFAILFYNVFLLFYIGDRVYLYYILYAASFIIFTSLYSGFGLYLFSSVKLFYALHASIAITVVFVVAFTRELLQVRRLSVRVDNGLIFIGVVDTLFALLIVVDVDFYAWFVVLGLFSILYLMGVGIYCFTKKVPLSRYYLLAMSWYLIGLFTTGGYTVGLFPHNTFTRYGFLMGSFCEMLLFSFALGYRVKILQDEKDTMQNKLLASEISRKLSLEMEVNQRTHELSTAVSDLDASHKKLLRLAQFKEDMTNTIIHDMKTPLSTIMNAKKMKNNTTWLDGVEQSGYRMYNLVQNILDVYKYEDTSVKLNKKQVVLLDVIKKAQDELRYLIYQKSLDVRISNNIKFILNVDEEFLRRVLVNLLSNAVKFSTSGSVITIDAVVLDSDVAKISVYNQGEEIPKDKQKVIFNKFEQISSSIGEKNHSTGLGLSFCKLAVEAHGGVIGVESEPNEDVEFWFTLPESTCLKHDSRALAHREENQILSPDDKLYLVPFVSRLKLQEIYEVSAINQILKEIDASNPRVALLVEEIGHAVAVGNSKDYAKILAMTL